MYGFATQYGYMGLVEGRWMLFSTEEEYYDYVKEAIIFDTQFDETY